MFEKSCALDLARLPKELPLSGCGPLAKVCSGPVAPRASAPASGTVFRPAEDGTLSEHSVQDSVIRQSAQEHDHLSDSETESVWGPHISKPRPLRKQQVTMSRNECKTFRKALE